MVGGNRCFFLPGVRGAALEALDLCIALLSGTLSCAKIKRRGKHTEKFKQSSN